MDSAGSSRVSRILADSCWTRGARRSSSENELGLPMVKRFNVVRMTDWSTVNGMLFFKPIHSLRLIALIAVLPLAATAQSSMKAIVVHSYGGPEVLKYEDAPRPEPKEDEILVRVIAAGVNPADGMIRAGMFAKNSKNAFPMVPGYDIAGIVEETGAKTDKYKTGDAG